MLRVVDKAGKPGVGLLSPATSAVPDLAQTARSPNWACPYWLATLLRIISFSCRQVSSP